MVCTAYKYKDKTYNYLPTDVDDLNNLSLDYIELNGWKEKTKNKRIFLSYQLMQKSIYLL